MAQQMVQQSALEKQLAELIARYQNTMNAGNNMGNNYRSAINAQQSAKDPNYALGMLAGKLVRDGFNSWRQHYDQRGADKAALQNQLTTLFRNKHGDNADSVIADLKSQGIWDNYKRLKEKFPQSQQPLTSGVLGNQNPLTSAADKIVNNPFDDMQNLTKEELLRRLNGGF